jgi:phosphoribulokinase
MQFVEDNVHGQCKYCNHRLAGNHVAYRAGLIARIGLEAVERIEADQTVRKYTKEGLIELARHYNAEARKLKNKG